MVAKSSTIKPVTEKRRDRILVVEDSVTMAEMIEDQLARILPGQIDVAPSLSQALSLLEQHADQYLAAIVDLVLPDAQGYEAPDALSDYDMPIIVFTGKDEHLSREFLFEKGWLDYVQKDTPNATVYLQRLLSRLYQNQKLKVLVVDDSASYRAILRDALEAYLFTVVDASSGDEALEILKKDHEIRLAVVDHIMPGMDGFTLVTELRNRFDSETLGIVGISGDSDPDLASIFLKYGADDFSPKPVNLGEFLVRVNACVENLDRVQRLHEQANKDFLTGLNNRRRFLDVASPLVLSSVRGDLSIALGVIDIDFFKAVNDTHGHSSGDKVLKILASVLLSRARRTDIVARLGGEEFCFLAMNPKEEHVETMFNQLRKAVENTKVVLEDGQEISVSISVGVCIPHGEDLQTLMDNADKALYQAKEDGRNCVRLFQEEDVR